MHHFNNVGLYDALFVMQDTESQTLWNHLTGDAEYGPMVGRTLGPPKNLLQMNVKQALEQNKKTKVAISERAYMVDGKVIGDVSAPRGKMGVGSVPSENGRMSEAFIKTLGAEDARRPRMEIGLGIWTTKSRRFYPIATIRDRGRAFIDQIDGRSTLIYIDTETNTPAALFVDAKAARLEGNIVRMDDGSSVRDGVLINTKGAAKPNSPRPDQMFTRWYGFALTFPGAEVVASK